MKNIFYLLIISLVLVGCNTNKKESNEVNLYSQRHYAVDELQYENFTKLTGIKVNFIKANADELIERLKNEGDNSPADLFVSVDAGKLQKASELGLLQKVNNEKINNNDPTFSDCTRIAWVVLKSVGLLRIAIISIKSKLEQRGIG